MWYEFLIEGSDLDLDTILFLFSNKLLGFARLVLEMNPFKTVQSEIWICIILN